MTKYVAFLRGINVGKTKRIGMPELKRAFEGAGFENVTTYIASGNVIFESPETDAESLTKGVEVLLEKTFGFSIGVIVRSADEVRRMVDSDPFNGIKVAPDTRLYVTLLSDKPNSSLPLPWESPQGDFTILRVSDGAIYSVLTLGATGTTGAMSMIEKQFGKRVTTRNWNVITKVATLTS